MGLFLPTRPANYNFNFDYQEELSMKIKKMTILLSSLGLLAACASKTTVPEPHDWALEVQTAETRDAHLKLADHYEEIAKTLDADAQEERAMLQQYMARPWKYGKKIQDLKAQGTAMVRDLEKAAQESRQMAEYHRQMAGEAK
jgi:hypothetical protein